MLSISIQALEIAFAVLWLLVRAGVWLKHRKVDWKHEALLLLLFVDLAIIIRFVFFPRDLVDGHIQPLLFSAAEAMPMRVNMVPLVHLLDFDSVRDILWNVVGNAVMFVPTGIVLPIIYKHGSRFWKVLAGGAFISLCIEVLQLPFPSRASDFDDIILNTLGVLVGFCIYAAIHHFTKRKAAPDGAALSLI